MIRVRELGDDLIFNGTAPWFTGWGAMNHVVLGGTLEDGRLAYVVVPVESSDHMCVSEPMRLCAMNASGTVSLTCRDLRVGKDRLMKIITREQMAQNDVAAILAPLSQPFGVIAASMDHLRSLGRSRADRAADSLEAQLSNLRAEAETWYDRTSAAHFKENALRIRACGITLGVRAAHAAVTAAGGRANSLDSPAQRLFREAMFYTLTAQTPDVQTATLDHIAEPESAIR